MSAVCRGVPGGKELSLEGQVFPWMRDAWEKGQLAEEEREGAGEEAGEGAKEEEEEEALRPEVGGGGATGGWAVSGPGGVEWRDEVCCVPGTGSSSCVDSLRSFFWCLLLLV